MDVKRVSRLVSMIFDEMRSATDVDRDLPIRWSVMHMYSSTQLAKIVALRRGMDMELAAIAAALHDIAVITTKKSEKHAEVAGGYVIDVIRRYNNGPWTNLPKITQEEEDIIINAIIQHSDKETYTDDAFVELLKDIDSFDRYLHGIKSEGAYLERCNRVMKELGIVTCFEYKYNIVK